MYKGRTLYCENDPCPGFNLTPLIERNNYTPEVLVKFISKGQLQCSLPRVYNSVQILTSSYIYSYAHNSPSLNFQ